MYGARHVGGGFILTLIYIHTLILQVSCRFAESDVTLCYVQCHVNLHSQHGRCHEKQVLYLIKLTAVALLRPEFKDMVTIKRCMICKITALLM
jgi:hypothetical protein